MRESPIWTLDTLKCLQDDLRPPSAVLRGRCSRLDILPAGSSSNIIKRILHACGENAEWRGPVLFGLYLGQRLGDLAKPTRRAVDLESEEIAFATRKTGRRIVLPLIQPLSDYLSGLPVADDPNAFIFPRRRVPSALDRSAISFARFLCRRVWRLRGITRKLGSGAVALAKPMRSHSIVCGIFSVLCGCS